MLFRPSSYVEVAHGKVTRDMVAVGGVTRGEHASRWETKASDGARITVPTQLPGDARNHPSVRHAAGIRGLFTTIEFEMVESEIQIGIVIQIQIGIKMNIDRTTYHRRNKLD